MRRGNSSTFSTSTDDSDNLGGQVVADLMPRHATTNIFSRNNSSNSGISLADSEGFPLNNTTAGTPNNSFSNQGELVLSVHNFITAANSRLPARSNTFSSQQSPVETANWLGVANRGFRRNESAESADTISANRYRIPNRQLSVPTHRNANSPEDRENFIRIQQELLQYQSSLRSRLSNSPRFVYQPSAEARGAAGGETECHNTARGNEVSTGNVTLNANTPRNSGSDAVNSGNGANTGNSSVDAGAAGAPNGLPGQIHADNYYAPAAQAAGALGIPFGPTGAPAAAPTPPPTQQHTTRVPAGTRSPRSAQPGNGAMAFASAMAQLGPSFVMRNVTSNTHAFSSLGSAGYFAQAAGRPGPGLASPPNSGRQGPRGGVFGLDSHSTFVVGSVGGGACSPLGRASTAAGLDVLSLPTRSLSQLEPVEVRLPREVVDAFPVNSFVPSAGGADECSRTCSVCLEDYRAGDQVRRLPCTHFYHRACIDTWLRKSTLCPICKFDFIIMLQF